MPLAKVRPEDRKGAFAAFLTIFGTLAGHTLLETARDALFLARLPASRLAFVYIAIAASAVAVSQSPWGRRRAGGAFALSRLLGGGALVTFLFWLLLRGQHPLELYALYVWTGLLGSLAVLQFWMVLGELYTLGEGNYSEGDVQEVARAFTGWGQRNGRFYFDPGRHDKGTKTVLGVTGKLDGDDVLEILLAQEACARHLAHALLGYFEGVEPAAETQALYMELLRG